MQDRRWTTLIVGVCFMFGTLASTPTSVPADELSELRKQITQQRQAMEMMERRLLQLEGKEQKRVEKEVDFGYAKPAGLRRDGLESQDIYDGGFYVRSKDKRYSLNIKQTPTMRVVLVRFLLPQLP